VPAIRQLWEVATKYGGSVIAVMEVPASQVSSYGIAAGTWVSDRVMRVSTMVEKPKPANAPSRFGIVGRYVLSPRVFALLERTRRGAIGEIQLTDALVALAKEEPVFALKFEGRRFDVGNKVGYVEASLFYALRDRDAGPKVRALLRRKWSVRPA
jgi:UTP--glucose-1-phosphate uridylyltransferase